MELQYKSLPFQVKSMDDQAGTATLYAAAFGNVDRQGDIIQPGAFSNLDTFVKEGWLAVNHDWNSLPVGTIEAATQDAKGLLLTTKWHTTEAGQACRTVVKERMDRGKAVKCSIGYSVLDQATETRDGEKVYLLKNLEIYEASIVNRPANPLAEVTDAKGAIRLSELRKEVESLKDSKALDQEHRDRLEGHCASMEAVCKSIRSILGAPGEENPSAPGDGGAGKAEAEKVSLRLRLLKARAHVS